MSPCQIVNTYYQIVRFSNVETRKRPSLCECIDQYLSYQNIGKTMERCIFKHIFILHQWFTIEKTAIRFHPLKFKCKSVAWSYKRIWQNISGRRVYYCLVHTICKCFILIGWLVFTIFEQCMHNLVTRQHYRYTVPLGDDNNIKIYIGSI